ncbi:MAG: flagellar hook-length control protein FliK [candidate division Zixibacteria bacterium]|nr:flagellar hook-length control protein FliK [candidate division Zixibacteria bacterium]
MNILPSGSPGTTTAKPSGAEPFAFGGGDGQTFESLMNLFGMAEPADIGIPSINKGAAERVSERSNLPGQSSIESTFASLLSGLPQVNLANDSGLSNESYATVEKPLSQGKQPILDVSKSLSLPELNIPAKLELPKAQPWSFNLTEQKAVDLKTGHYQILKQDLNNGTLKLELASPEHQGEPIKVSIPVELLRKESRDVSGTTPHQSLKSPNAPVRVPFTVHSTSGLELEQLIGKVNLREMEVSVQPTSSVYQQADEPVALQIFAEQAGQKFLLAGTMEKSRLHATCEIKRSTSSMAARPVEENPSPASQFGLTVDMVAIPRRRIIRPVAFATDEQAKSEDFKLIEKLMSAGTKEATLKQDGIDQMITDAKASAANTSLEQKLATPRVKVTVPMDLPRLKADGRSILLKIEPEHLGPAKLHLTMRNESLSARVTVESAQAKAAIEGSLNQLTDQLARAGVKVDYIDVGVRGGGAENQFSQRQADWFRAQQPRVMKFADELLNDAAMILPASRPVSFIGAGSVNLFA